MGVGPSLHEHPNFGGQRIQGVGGQYNAHPKNEAHFPNFPTNDIHSSLDVPGGYYADIWEHVNYQGKTKRFGPGRHIFGPEWDNVASSAKFYQGVMPPTPVPQPSAEDAPAAVVDVSETERPPIANRIQEIQSDTSLSSDEKMQRIREVMHSQMSEPRSPPIPQQQPVPPSVPAAHADRAPIPVDATDRAPLRTVATDKGPVATGATYEAPTSDAPLKPSELITLRQMIARHRNLEKERSIENFIGGFSPERVLVIAALVFVFYELMVNQRHIKAVLKKMFK